MSNQPNILWLVWDCGRSDHVSRHGHKRNTTPHLDKLIESGIDYRRAYSSAIWSLPGYASLLTGHYPRQHLVNTPENYLSSDVETLPQTLRDAGYYTACFSNNAWLSNFTGISSGFGEFKELWYSAQNTYKDKSQFLLSRLQGYLVGDADKNARMTNSRLIKALKATRGRPYFMFAAYMELHWPYTFHGNTSKQLLKLEEQELVKKSLKEEDILWWFLPEINRCASDETKEIVQLKYDIEMRYLDAQTHRLLKQLEDEGLLKNTIVIITADHGELLGEQGMFGHQFSVLEPVRHVPLVVWSPDLLPSGVVIDDIVQTTDIARTVCEWCGIEWGGNKDGTFTLPLTNGEGEREFAITDYPVPLLEPVSRSYPSVDLTHLDHGLACISNESYKMTYRSDGLWQAYQATDLNDEYPLSIRANEELLKLRSSLEIYLSRDVAMTDQHNDLPDDLRRHFEALGYL